MLDGYWPAVAELLSLGRFEHAMSRDETTPHQQPWFAVKCLFSHPSRAEDGERFLYEERTTLWRASTFQEAFALAEAEAAKYARDSHSTFVRATDSYHLFDESIGHGSEIWSLMRGSGMEPELYAQTFCSTPRDRAEILDDDSSTH